MECEVVFTDDFEQWWNGLTEQEQISVAHGVQLLERYGVALKYPQSSGIATSASPGMRELRIQHEGHPYRELYIFDPKRNAVLLIGGDKTGNDRWYEIFVPVADRIYGQYLREIKEEK